VESDFVTVVPPKGFGYADTVQAPFGIPCTKSDGSQCSILDMHDVSLYINNSKSALKAKCQSSSASTPPGNTSTPAFNFPLDPTSNVTTVGANVAAVSSCTASGLGVKRHRFRRDSLPSCLLPAYVHAATQSLMSIVVLKYFSLAICRIISTTNCPAVQSQVLQNTIALIRAITPSLITNLTAIGTPTENPAVKAYFVRFFDPDVAASNVAAVKSVFQTLSGAVVNGRRSF
jgi:hypothetical protein